MVQRVLHGKPYPAALYRIPYDIDRDGFFGRKDANGNLAPSAEMEDRDNLGSRSRQHCGGHRYPELAEA